MSEPRGRLRAAIDRTFVHNSGRVVACCRAVLAATFFLALWIDPQQPVRETAYGYGLLAGYVLFAAVFLAVSWNDWWLNHRLAFPALVVDTSAFLAAVYFTESVATDFTSPFLSFFAFLLLAAAIRWGWQAALATGLAVTVLYLLVGVTMAVSGLDFDPYRFGRRVIYMSVLSLVIAWFVLQRREPRVGRFSEPAAAEPGDLPLQAALAFAADQARARTAVIAWADFEEPHTRLYAIGRTSPPDRVGPAFDPEHSFGSTVRLFDRRRGCSLVAGPDGRVEAVQSPVHEPLAELCELDQALALPVSGPTGRGELLLADIDGLCGDHVQLGVPVAREVSMAFDHHAGLALAGERVMAAMRDSLARDLHDSVAQSLAGAALRLEGLRGWIERGGDPGPEIDSIKQGLREEQHHVRSLIARLRRGESGGGAMDAETTVRVLLPALEKYWSVSARLISHIEGVQIPTWLAHEIDGILREGVANAVRHGKARAIAVDLTGDESLLTLTITDDGKGFPAGAELVLPRSISERVAALGGTLTILPVERGACLRVDLPLRNLQ